MAFKPKAKTTAIKPAPELPPMPQAPAAPIVDPVPETPIKQQVAQVWAVREIPTETQAVIYNQETEETLDVLGALVKILNLIEEEE